MNIFERAFCRVFQFCFKVAIPLLPYYNPRILDKVEDISQVLIEKNISRVMLVTDKSIRGFGITQALENNLKENWSLNTQPMLTAEWASDYSFRREDKCGSAEPVLTGRWEVL